MKTALKFIAFIIISSTIMVSCSEVEAPEGCTDITALNFDNRARVDDGSCEYLDSIVTIWGDGAPGFWRDLATGSFDITSCFSTPTTIVLNPDTVVRSIWINYEIIKPSRWFRF